MVYSTINPDSLKLQMSEKWHRCVGTASTHGGFVASKFFAGLTESDGACTSSSVISLHCPSFMPNQIFFALS